MAWPSPGGGAAGQALYSLAVGILLSAMPSTKFEPCIPTRGHRRSHDAEPRNRICSSGFDCHGRDCLRPETWRLLARTVAPNLPALRINQRWYI